MFGYYLKLNCDCVSYVNFIVLEHGMEQVALISDIQTGSFGVFNNCFLFYS